MTDWTKETKSQSPHWKNEDITNRTVTRGKIEDVGDTTRGGIAKYVFDDPSADVRRVDMENKYGSKNTTSFTEEDKYGLGWFICGWFYGWFATIINWTEEIKE